MRMNRIIAAFTALCFVGGTSPTVYNYISDCAVTANAETDFDGNKYVVEISDGLEYWVYQDYAELARVLYSEEPIYELVVPSEVNGVPVTSIGHEFGMSVPRTLKSVIIPDTVKKIGRFAFAGCTDLEDIVIPESVTEISIWVFSETKWLENKRAESPLVIVNNILVDGQTFEEDELIITDDIKSIAGGAFYGNTAIKTVYMSDSVTSVGIRAFLGCTSLEKVKLSENLEMINHSMFDNCSALKEIELPNGLKEIGYNSFSRCSALTELKIPNSVEQLYESAFSGCYGISSIVIPSSVKNIRAFPDYEYIGEGGLGMSQPTFSGIKTIIFENPDCYIAHDDALYADPDDEDYEYIIRELKGIIVDGYDDWFNFTGTIYGYAGSTAQIYAEKCEYNFVPLGDSNGDSKVSIADAVTLQRYILGNGELNDWRAADLCADGTIDAFDMVLMRQLLIT